MFEFVIAFCWLCDLEFELHGQLLRSLFLYINMHVVTMLLIYYIYIYMFFKSNKYEPMYVLLICIIYILLYQIPSFLVLQEQQI